MPTALLVENGYRTELPISYVTLALSVQNLDMNKGKSPRSQSGTMDHKCQSTVAALRTVCVDGIVSQHCGPSSPPDSRGKTKGRQSLLVC